MAIFHNLLKQFKSSQAKAIALYTFSNFFNKGISFLFLFYFTSVLTVSDFGLLNLFSNSILFLMPFISMGIIQSANTDFFTLEKKEFKDFFTTTLLMPLAVMVIAIVIFYLFQDQLHRQYSFPKLFIILIPIITFLNFLNEQLIALVRNNNEPIKYMLINIGSLLIELTLAVFFISALNYGWIGRVTGILISLTIVGIYAVIYFKQKGFIVGKIKKIYIYKELIYSIPIVVMQISIFCMSSSAGYFIEYFTNDYNAIGIFSVAVTLSSVVAVLSAALLHYFYPKIYSLLSETEVDYRSIRKNFLYFAAGMLICTFVLIAAIPIVYIWILKKSYEPGLQYYYFICFGYFFWAITYFLYSFLLYHKAKKKIFLLSLIAILISCTSHYFFIKNLGGFGAAVSIFTIYFLMLVITFLFVRKQIAPAFQNK